MKGGILCSTVYQLFPVSAFDKSRWLASDATRYISSPEIHNT